MLARQSRRWLSLLEHQAKSLLSKASLPVQRFTVIDKLEGTRDLPSWLQTCPRIVVKAQVSLGGRGAGHFIDPKSGHQTIQSGVHLVSNLSDALNLSDAMLGKVLITKQGRELCSEVMLAEAVDIREEMYLAFKMNRAGIQVVWNRKGGMNIEEDSAENETKIVTLLRGHEDIQMQAIAEDLGISSVILEHLFHAMRLWDATMVEINPLATLPNGSLMLIDAKIEIDDYALARQQVDKGKSFVGNYVKMTDGNIGCLVNGAGLAMATMDMLKLCGGKPANFLDIGGNAGEEEVSEAIRMLEEDPQVRSIWVNVFGGIVRGDLVAKGVVKASPFKPTIIRLIGSNWDVGQNILLQKKQIKSIFWQQDFSQAAQLAVCQASQQQAEPLRELSL